MSALSYPEPAHRELVMESLPKVMFVEAVKGCPNPCAFCKLRKSKWTSISPELLEKLEPAFDDLEVLQIHDEPLLADLPYFVDRSRKHDFVLHMATTGLLLTKKRADLLRKTRLSIYFSLHAATQRAYKRVMGQDLKRVTDNIRYLTTRGGEESDHLLSYIVSKETIDDIDELLKLARYVGVPAVRFMSLLPSVETLKGQPMTEDFTYRYFEQWNREVREKFMNRLPEIKRRAAEMGVEIRPGTMESAAQGSASLQENFNRITRKVVGKKFLPLTKRPGDCIVPWMGQLIVHQDGEVDLCCFDRYVIGNLNDSSLEEIWNSQRMQDVRLEIMQGYLPKACGLCRGISMDEYPKNAFQEERKALPAEPVAA